MRTLSKTTALSNARQYVSVTGTGNNWTVYKPFSNDALNGATTSTTFTSRKSAILAKNCAIAIIAAKMLGYTDDYMLSIDYAAYAWYGNTAAELLNYASMNA